LDNQDVPESGDEEDDKYEASERAYLLAVREGESNRQVLGTLAAAVHDAAKAWESAAYRRFFSARKAGVTGQELIEMEINAEKGEMLAELWADIADAHTAR
jgi:hypothetical protein